jgi:hypothetical protein
VGTGRRQGGGEPLAKAHFEGMSGIDSVGKYGWICSKEINLFFELEFAPLAG